MYQKSATNKEIRLFLKQTLLISLFLTHFDR